MSSPRNRCFLPTRRRRISSRSRSGGRHRENSRYRRRIHRNGDYPAIAASSEHPANNYQARSREDPIPRQERSDDYLLRKIVDLERALQHSEAEANSHRKRILDLEALNGDLLAEKLKCDQKGTAYRRVSELKEEATRMKADMRVLRSEVRSALGSFNGEYDEMKGHINAILDTGLLRLTTAFSARTDGKIVVEERHLKKLLHIVMFNTRALVGDLEEAASRSKKK